MKHAMKPRRGVNQGHPCGLVVLYTYPQRSQFDSIGGLLPHFISRSLSVCFLSLYHELYGKKYADTSIHIVVWAMVWDILDMSVLPTFNDSLVKALSCFNMTLSLCTK